MKAILNTLLPSPGIACWNPAFDITPADLITGGVVTEAEVIVPPSATLSG